MISCSMYLITGNLHPPEQTRNSPDLATTFLCCGQVSRVLLSLEVIDFLFGFTLWRTNVSVETLKSTVAHWSP